MSNFRFVTLNRCAMSEDIFYFYFFTFFCVFVGMNELKATAQLKKRITRCLIVIYRKIG